MARMLDTPDVDFDSSSMDDGQDILLQQYDLEMQATAFSLSRRKSSWSLDASDSDGNILESEMEFTLRVD